MVVMVLVLLLATGCCKWLCIDVLMTFYFILNQKMKGKVCLISFDQSFDFGGQEVSRVMADERDTSELY